MKKMLLFLLIFFSQFSYASIDNYLFFQTAPKANIAKLHKNNYILTLNSLTDVSYFKEETKTKKKVGILSLSQFFSLWDDNKQNFMDHPPNAVISMVSENNGKQQVIVATVSNPGFAKGAVSYQISVLDNTQVQQGDFKHIALFFDDIHWNPTKG